MKKKEYNHSFTIWKIQVFDRESNLLLVDLHFLWEKQMLRYYREHSEEWLKYDVVCGGESVFFA